MNERLTFCLHFAKSSKMLNLGAADLIEIHTETATLWGTKISGEKTKEQMGKLFTKISYVSFLFCHFHFKNNPPVKFKLIKK